MSDRSETSSIGTGGCVDEGLNWIFGLLEIGGDVDGAIRSTSMARVSTAS